jgi:molybdate transport system substrate-binding protein
MRLGILALVSALILGAPAEAVEVSVLASNAVRSPLDELLPQFERVSGHRVSSEFHTAFALKAKIDKGQLFDLTILGREQIEELTAQKIVDAASHVELAVAVAGVVVRKGAAKPDVRTVESFKQALSNANSIALVETGAVGLYFKKLFDKLGIAEIVAPKMKWLKSTDQAGGVPLHNPTALAVAAGQAEIGMTQVSEILPTPGAELAGPLPDAIQLYTPYVAGVRSGALQAQAAKELIEFLRSSSARSVFNAKGLVTR